MLLGLVRFWLGGGEGVRALTRQGRKRQANQADCLIGHPVFGIPRLVEMGLWSCFVPVACVDFQDLQGGQTQSSVDIVGLAIPRFLCFGIGILNDQFLVGAKFSQLTSEWAATDTFLNKWRDGMRKAARM